MSRITFNGARTGRRAPSRGGMLSALKYDMGERKRIVFPIVDGGLVIFAKPYHPVMNKSVSLLRSRGGGTYAVNKIRCMHPYSQTNPTESLSIAKKGEICLFCDIAKYESRRQWDEIREEFGEDGFSKLSKKEMKEYFGKAEEDKTVDASFYREKNDDNENESKTLLDIYILALEMRLDKSGKVVMDSDGVAEYTPIVVPASKSRLNKFKEGVDNALASETIQEDILSPYLENEGTDAEEEVLIGFVDFMVNFPKESDKMTSGRNMSATPVSEAASVITDELIENFEDKADAIVKQAESLINNFYKNLQPHTRAEALEFMDGDGEDYFKALEAEFRMDEIEREDGTVIKSDDDRDAEILANVIDNVSTGNDDAKEDSGGEEEEADVEEAPKKKKRTAKPVVEEDAEEEKKPRKRTGTRRAKTEKAEAGEKKPRRTARRAPKKEESETLDDDSGLDDEIFNV